MRTVPDAILAGLLAVAFASAAGAQPARLPKAPASAASVPLPPMTVASNPLPAQSPAVRAAENAKEPGEQRPEERVIPQLSVPLKSRKSAANAEIAASVPAGSVPGAVNDAAARCLAKSGAEKAACERAAAAGK